MCPSGSLPRPVPLLVISCDSYRDLWKPFFALFWLRWPDCPYPVYLGTNSTVHEDARVTTLCVGDDESWSSGVREMLARLDSDYVITFLEDFFIRERVRTEVVTRLVQIARGRQLGCLRLAAGLPLAFPPSYPVGDVPGVGVIAPREAFRVSAQVAIWRTETLKQLLVPGLSAWEFEAVGTKLSDRLTDPFWGTYEPAIAYMQGVEKGKWKPEGLAICRAAGIEVDLKARGAFGDDEFRQYEAEIAQQYQCYEAKRRGMRHFLAGERGPGVRCLIRFLRRQPGSVRAWTILVAGLLGSRCMAWLERQHVRLRASGRRP